MDSEHTSLINKILHLITRDSDQLITSFIKQDRANEIRLIRDITNILNRTKYHIPNYQLENEISQVR